MLGGDTRAVALVDLRIGDVMETPTIDVLELMLEWCEWAYYRGATATWMAKHA